MSNLKDRLAQALLLLVMGLALFVLGCGIKQVTTEVWDDGSGRNVFLFASARAEEGSQEAAAEEQDLEEARRKVEACGARTLPYEDEQYTGIQAVFDFRSFSEIPGQITCFVGSAGGLQIDGWYEEETLKSTYTIQTRISPQQLWLVEGQPMLYRVTMPGRITEYTDLQTTRARTEKEAKNRISWYFTSYEGDDAETEYILTVRAEKPAVPGADLVSYGAIFLLTIALVAAIGALLWKVAGKRTSRKPQRRQYLGDGGRQETRAKQRQPAVHTRRQQPTPPARCPAPGTVLDRYLIQEELGHGGMAVVYRARHTALHREVALKLLAPELTATADFVERFRREGRILAQLSHPNIVTVFDAGESQGCYYLAMELVRGPTLAQGLSHWGPMKPRQATAIALQIAEALDHAHRKGIIHRDIKPANILLDQTGGAKVADFGIVAMLGESQVARTRIGTPRYMAYEQFNGAAMLQSDQYGLGVCLYEMLTAQLPPAFGLETPAPPSHLKPSIAPALDHVVLKTLRPDPGRRYATTREFIVALRQASDQQK